MNPRSSVISLYWDPQISQSGGETGSWLPDNKNKCDPPMNSSATFWIRAEWNVGAAWCLNVSFVWSLCFSELRWPTWCCSSDADWSNENTLTVDGLCCWSSGAVGVWEGGCSLHPVSSHWYIYTVVIENSLGRFTWDDSCKTDSVENTISRWR